MKGETSGGVVFAIGEPTAGVSHTWVDSWSEPPLVVPHYIKSYLN